MAKITLKIDDGLIKKAQLLAAGKKASFNKIIKILVSP